MNISICSIYIYIQQYYKAVSRRWKTVPGLGTAAGQFRSEVLGVGARKKMESASLGGLK